MNIRHKILREEREPDENIPLKVPKLANLNYVLFRDTCVRATCTKKSKYIMLMVITTCHLKKYSSGKIYDITPISLSSHLLP